MMKIIKKTIYAILIIALAGGFLSFVFYSPQINDVWTRSLESEAQNKAMKSVEIATILLNDDLSRFKGKVLDLASEQNMLDFATLVNNGQDYNALYQPLLIEFHSLAATSNLIMQISYTDKNGQEILAVNRESPDQSPQILTRDQLISIANADYFKSGIRHPKNATHVSDIGLNIEKKRFRYPYNPTIVFVAPVYDNNDRQAGIVYISTFADQMIQEIRDVINADFILLNKNFEYLYTSENTNQRWINHYLNINSQYIEIIEHKNIINPSRGVILIPDTEEHGHVINKIFYHSHDKNDYWIISLDVESPPIFSIFYNMEQHPLLLILPYLIILLTGLMVYIILINKSTGRF